MKQYLDAVKEVLNTGTRKENRTGVDTLSTFNINYEIDMQLGFPLLTTKEISWKNIVIENLWFLSGEPNIKLLKKHDCKFWDAWADENGLVPSAYGNFWNFFPSYNSDHGRTYFNNQIKWALNELNNNPMSRRLCVSSWNPDNAQTSKLPPCHVFWILNVQLDKDGFPNLCLHLTQRSCDIALGVPYNIAGYGFLLELIGHISGYKTGVFAHTLVDAHVYTSKPDGSMSEYDHIPGLEAQINRATRVLPKLRIDPAIRTIKDIRDLMHEDTNTILNAFKLYGYDPHPAIKFKVAV